jgi:hypothetical protein
MTCTDPGKEKRWFSYKGKKVRGFNLAVDEKDVARNVGLPREELKIKPAEWDGKRFIVKKEKK